MTCCDGTEGCPGGEDTGHRPLRKRKGKTANTIKGNLHECSGSPFVWRKCLFLAVFGNLDHQSDPQPCLNMAPDPWGMYPTDHIPFPLIQLVLNTQCLISPTDWFNMNSKILKLKCFNEVIFTTFDVFRWVQGPKIVHCKTPKSYKHTTRPYGTVYQVHNFTSFLLQVLSKCPLDVRSCTVFLMKKGYILAGLRGKSQAYGSL